MTRPTRIILFAAGGAAGLVILIAVTATLLLRTNLKSRVQAVASEALDMEVNVRGRTAIHVFPRFSVTLADVHARKSDAEVGSAAEVELAFEVLPLLHREYRISAVALKRLRIALEEDASGKLNVARSPGRNAALPELAVANASISDATITYVNRQSGNKLEATGCDLDVSRLSRPQGQGDALLKNLSLKAKLSCSRTRTEDFTASDLKLAVEGKKGIFDLAPVTMRLFGGHGSGSIRADYSGSVPEYQVRYEVKQLRIEEFFKAAAPKPMGTGSMDFATKLSLRGDSIDALKRSAEGEASLHGEELTLAVGDLDKKFARYESSQNFNLVDLGAFFFVGPLGPGITKGYDFARILEGSEGSTRIHPLVSTWRVEHGVAQAMDVAMATPENRVVLKGGLDFVSGQFDEVTVALVDDKGCSRVQQRIRGSFLKPDVEQPNVLAALAGPTTRLLKQAKKLLGAKCEVFYDGTVAPPG